MFTQVMIQKKTFSKVLDYLTSNNKEPRVDATHFSRQVNQREDHLPFLSDLNECVDNHYRKVRRYDIRIDCSGAY